MSDQTERDALAEVLDRHRPIEDGIETEFFGPRLYWLQCSCREWRSETDRGWRRNRVEEHRAHVAEAISNWLVEHDRRVRAEALREAQRAVWTEGGVQWGRGDYAYWLAERADRIEDPTESSVNVTEGDRGE